MKSQVKKLPLAKREAKNERPVHQLAWMKQKAKKKSQVDQLLRAKREDNK